MDEIKRIDSKYLQEIYATRGFTIPLITKDYYLTLILYLIKDVKGIYFKGGTALNKIFLNHARLSEDIDFTISRNTKEIQKEISKILKDSGLFGEITEDKNVEGFLRMVIHYNLEGQKGEVFIDLNKRANVVNDTEKHKLNHFYEGFVPEFEVNTLSKEEIIAEKFAATIGRNKPRDHFDVYQIIHAKMPINLELAKKKCADSNDEFSIIKMFNNSKKLKNRWDEDMVPLLAKSVSFQEVIQFLSKHFKLKEEKEKSKHKK
ncbi:MAG: nucleotidyl transferase AbiEii/AbiGii toxin family protein [Nanoarchaeota archaeon]